MLSRRQCCHGVGRRLIGWAVAACLLPLAAGAQCFDRAEQPFRSGEHLHYDVYYHWGLMWVDAGLIDFRVGTAYTQDQYAHSFQAVGVSKPRWDWVYMVRDTFEASATLKEVMPLQFRRTTSEGSYKVNNRYTFDRQREQVQARLYNSEDGSADTVLNTSGCALDVLTAIYNCRMVDFASLQVGEKVPVRMIISGEVYDLYIRYLGLEDTKLKGGKRFRCRKFSILLVKGTIFQGGEDMTVWVTDDRNKVPVKVAAKILVGEVEAQLVNAKGLAFPVEAQLE